MKVRVRIDVEVLDPLLLRAYTSGFMGPDASALERVHRLTTSHGFFWAEGVAGVLIVDSDAVEFG